MLRCLLWHRTRRCLSHSLSMQTTAAVIIYVVLLVSCANWITASLSAYDAVQDETTAAAIEGRRSAATQEFRAPDAHLRERYNEAKPRPAITTQQRLLEPLAHHVEPREVQLPRTTERPSSTEPPNAGGYIAQQRIVHFDLKGAPPSVEYFEQLLPLLARAGATGILIEWEDTFPYQALPNAVAAYAYTREQVGRILFAAANAHLDVIPLVQTLGHLEWILKTSTYAHFRDNPANSQIMCVAKEEAYQLLRQIIDEVIDVHQEYAPVKYVHIGCDEVFQLGFCAESRKKIQELGGKDRYMLWHMARLARHIKQKTNNSANTMVWHDMIVSMSPSDITRIKNVTSLIEPVIWMYAENLDMFLQPYIWQSLKIFDSVWGASAYKGADGPMRYHSNVQHYIRNHHSWVQQMTMNAGSMKHFGGMILTGWSRYDHFAVLAELLPVAVPSLLMSLTILRRGIPPTTSESVQQQYQSLTPLVNCTMNPTWNGGTGNIGAQGCHFPGVDAYRHIQRLRHMRDHLRQSIWSDVDPGFDYNGWLGHMNIEKKYSSAYYMDKIMPQLQSHMQMFVQLYKDLHHSLKGILHDVTITEFIYEYVWPDLDRLIEAWKAAQAVKATNTFDARPLSFEKEKALMQRAIDEL